MGALDETLKNAFRTLFAEVPYRSISINDICHAANISRTAFYKLYSSKEELLTRIMLDDLCEPVRTIRATIPTKKFNAQANLIIDEVRLANVQEHAGFYRKVLKDCPDIYLRELAKGFASVNREVLESYPLEEQEKDYMAFFYASGMVMLLAKWIHEGMDVPPEQLANWYQRWATDNWKAIAVESGMIDRLQRR